MKVVFVVIALVISSVSIGQEAPKPTEVEKVIAFLRNNVIGKTFTMENPEVTEISLGKTTYKIEYKRTIEVSKLNLTPSGFYFDITSEAEYKKSSKEEMPEAKNRKIKQRYELSERESTGDVLGFVRTVSDSDNSSTGEAYTLSAEINKDGALQLEDTLLMYTDLSLDNGKTVFPGASASTILFSIEKDGKTKMDQSFTFFEVSPETFVRVPLNGADGKAMKPIHVINTEKK